MEARMRMRSVFVSILILLVSAPAFAAITGTVITTDGQPVAGAKISLFTPETADARRARWVSKSPQRTALATTQSDSKGNYSIDSPKEPLFDLRIDAVGYAPEATRVLPDEEIGVIGLAPAATQRGTITAGGKPVAGATVILTGSSELILTSDAEGHYSAPDATKWVSRIIVAHPDHAVLSESMGPFAATKKGLDRSLEPGVAIRGKVLSSDGKTPVANAAILVDRWQVATTGEDGAFAIAHAPKDWTITEARADNRVGTRARATGDLTIKLEKAAAVSGVVFDGKSQMPLAGFEVRLMPPMMGGMAMMGGEAAYSAFTNAKGVYTITPVAPGSYQVNPTKPGFVTPNVSVSVTSGQTAQKAMYANARGRIVGSVTDEDKRPVAGARVASRAAAREAGMMIMGPGRNFGQDAATHTGPDGRFVLRSVATESDLQVDATKKGSPTGRSAQVRLAPGERKGGVLITIPRGVALTGKVSDREGRPVSGVAVEAVEASQDQFGGMRRMVIAMASGDRGDDMARTASDGTFSIRVKEGNYDVVFKREGYAAKTVRGQVVSASAQPINVTLDPGVEITGRVVRNGVGVEGVNVNAMSQDGMGNSVTGPDGSFRIEDLTPGQMMLGVNKREDFLQQMRPVTAPARDVIIEVPPGTRITGRVVDKNTKAPVTSFQAGISTSRGGGGMMIATPPMLKAFTSDDGTFTLDGVPAGPTAVVVQAPGYTTARLPSINVEEGKPVTDVEVLMDIGVKLTGRVTGPDGGPLAGVTVRQDQMQGGRMMRFDAMDTTTVTDPRGEYTIEALEAGEKTFQFSRQGYLNEWKSVTLSTGSARLDAQLSTGVRLTGSVVAEGGGPVGDAVVTASSASDSAFGPKQARTDGSGNFQIEGLAPGHYRLTATKSGYANGTLLDFDVAAGAPARITMKSGGIIIGRVTGLTEQELQSATVTANSPSGNASAPVDSTGSFRIEGSPTGTVRLAARTGQMFGANAKSSPMKSIQVDPGSSVTVDLEFKSNTVVRGRVTRDGQPLANAALAFMPKSAQAQTNASSTTDSAGNYEVSGLDDAQYNVQVMDFGRLNPFTTTYEVKGSGTFDIDIKASSVRGRVTDANTGAALVDARVELRPSTGESFMGSRVVMTDAAGGFTLDGVARGTYEAKADKEGYGHEIRSITVGDSSNDLEFKLAPGAGITLTVVDGRDNRMISAGIARITDAQGRNVDTPTFRFGGSPEPLKLTVSPGTYRVSVIAQGYAAQTFTLSSPSSPTVRMTPGGTVVIRSKSSAISRARLVDSSGLAYVRSPFGGQSGIFTIDASPGVTTLQNIAPGTFRLELLGPADEVLKTVPVNVIEGQPAQVEI
jgi:protocatechuate 3,4-dioxygenase beta subunit